MLFLLPQVIATPITVPPERERITQEQYIISQLFENPYNQCASKQNKDLIFIPYRSEERTNKTNLIQRYCHLTTSSYKYNNSEECINKSQIILVQQEKTACDYIKNPKECNSCTENINLKKNINAILLILGTIIFLFSIIYFITLGIYALLKKRLLGPKWLLVLTIISFLFIILSYVYILFKI